MNKHLQDIVYNFAERAGYYFVVFISKKRTQHLVRKRWECWQILMKEGYSPEEIAEVFNDVPSTIRYGLKRIKQNEHTIISSRI